MSKCFENATSAAKAAGTQSSRTARLKPCPQQNDFFIAL
jgi:hypothetical protein